jgi:adenosylhomocysteine nucleosidase
MIGLIVALKSEVSIVNSFIKDIKPHTVDGYKCYVITLLGKQLVLIYSGVGKVNAAIATYILINHFSVDLIINAGLCGYLKDTENEIGTFFIPRFVTYFDVDATIFDYEINQLPHENAKYEIDNELINNLYR